MVTARGGQILSWCLKTISCNDHRVELITGSETLIILSRMITGSENLIISGDKSKIPQTHQGLAESCFIEWVKMPVLLLRVACLCPEGLHGIVCVQHL